MIGYKPHILRNNIITSRVEKVFQILDRNNNRSNLITSATKEKMNDRTEIYKDIYDITFNTIVLGNK